jgi:hypothetical protein
MQWRPNWIQFKFNGWRFWARHWIYEFRNIHEILQTQWHFIECTILFAVVEPCVLVSSYRRFGETCCFHLQGYNIMTQKNTSWTISLCNYHHHHHQWQDSLLWDLAFFRISRQFNFYGVMSAGPPLWSSGQNSWLLTQRSRVRFPSLPDFLSSSGSGTGSTQPLWG